MAEELDYFSKIFEQIPRQGPGCASATKQALSWCDDLPQNADVLDIGCGSGAQTFDIAEELPLASIIAIDTHQPFLDRLQADAKRMGWHTIVAKNISMMEMPFEHESFDLIWSEGALYIMGFLQGLQACFRLLKPGGYAAVTEAVYLRDSVPASVKRFWDDEYSDIASVEQKVEQITESGLTLIHHFTLSPDAWLKNFYTPMKEVLKRMNDQYAEQKDARTVLRALEDEIFLYEEFGSYFGYEFFIMHRD